MTKNEAMDDLKHSVAVALAMGDTFIPDKLMIKAIDAMDALIANDDMLFVNDANIISIGVINHIADWAVRSVKLYDNTTYDEIIMYINKLIKNNNIEHKKELCIAINKVIAMINNNAGSSFPEIIIE